MSVREIERQYIEKPDAIGYRPGVLGIGEWLDTLASEPSVDVRSLVAEARTAYWQVLEHKLARRRRIRTGDRGGRLDEEAGVGELFRRLAGEWKTDTRFESSLSQIVTHRAYQRIIGLGHDALPLILEELERDPRQWFWALSAITGEDPAEGEESVAGATSKWLEWARARELRRTAVTP